MRALGLTLALALACAASAARADAAPRSVLNYGDSLAVGTGLFLRPLLAGWSVRDDASTSRHADEAPAALGAYGGDLPRVVLVSLGANDDPARPAWFRAQVLAVLRIAGPGRCVIWSTVVRPPYRGVSYEGYNAALRELDRASSVLHVFDWAALARAHRDWFRRDGVHPTATGYRARAAAVAQLAKSCT